MGETRAWLVSEVERLRAEIERLANVIERDVSEPTEQAEGVRASPRLPETGARDVPLIPEEPGIPGGEQSPPADAPEVTASAFAGGVSTEDSARLFEPSYNAFEWEPRVGARWLAWVGVVALILGSAFFLRLAYDNGWIQETGLVALGVAFGFALVGLGEYWHGRYPGYAATLAGGGTGIIYLSFFAAHTPFDLMPLGLALLLLFLVSALLAVQAARYEQLSLAIIAIGGAYLAPLALTGLDAGLTETSSNSDVAWPIAYLMIVGIGVVYLSTFRQWRGIVLIGLAGSIVGYMRWYIEVEDVVSAATAQSWLTAIFLVWVGATVLHHLVRRSRPRGFDVYIVVGNAAFFALMSYALLWSDFRGWMGLYTLLLGLFYGGVGYALYRQSEDNALLAYSMGVMAVVISAIAVPIQLSGPWVTAVWFAASLAFMSASAARSSSAGQTRSAGLGILGLATGWLVIFDITAARDLGIDPIFNRYVLSFAAGAVAAYGTAGLVRRFPDISPERGFATRPEVISGLVMLGSGFITVGIWTQIPERWFALAWGAEAIVLMALSFGTGLPEIRRTVYGLLAIAAVRALAFDSIVDREGYTILWNDRSIAFVPVIVAVALGALALRKQRERAFGWEDRFVVPVMVVVCNGLALWYLSAEVIGAIANDAVSIVSREEDNVISLSLSVLWAGYAGIALLLGVVKRWKQVRAAALLLLAVPVVKLFVFDTFALDSGYRVAAFMSLGVLLVAGGYLYQRYEEAVKGFLFETGDEQPAATPGDTPGTVSS